MTAHPHSTWHKVTALVGVVLFIVASWVLVREITHLGAGALIHALASVPRSVLGMVIGLVAVNYFVLTLHDQLAFVYAGIRLSRFKIFLASFVGYAVSNNLGFAMLSGGSARYRFHGRWGVHPADLSRVVLFFATAFWVGISLIGVVTWGTLVGSTLPMLLRRLRFDPANASAPLVATLSDVTGLIIYFSIAKVLLLPALER